MIGNIETSRRIRAKKRRAIWKGINYSARVAHLCVFGEEQVNQRTNDDWPQQRQDA